MAPSGARAVPRPRPAPDPERRMPTYEYRCLECQAAFECCETMKEHEAAQPKCPKCGSERVERLLSAFTAKTRRKS